jgi:putative ABC transport system ATP-binding protein
VHAVDAVDFTVAPGEFVAVVGPSGSGKTTLLNCCSGLDRPDGGIVELAGRDLHGCSDDERARVRARSMGFVFQTYNLLPVLTAVENVELPLLLGGASARRARRRAREMLARVGLTERRNHVPSALSGGEQQRVAIARALGNDPKIVWADEPTAALDSENAAIVMALLYDLHRAGQTIVIVTHDARVSACAERIVRMRDGRIVSDERVQSALAHIARVG